MHSTVDMSTMDPGFWSYNSTKVNLHADLLLTTKDPLLTQVFTRKDSGKDTAKSTVSLPNPRKIGRAWPTMNHSADDIYCILWTLPPEVMALRKVEHSCSVAEVPQHGLQHIDAHSITDGCSKGAC